MFASSDVQATGVLAAAAAAGLRVPEDLSVIGFDDIELSAYAGLTTVRQPLFESGRLGAELLLAALDGGLRLPGPRAAARARGPDVDRPAGEPADTSVAVQPMRPSADRIARHACARRANRAEPSHPGPSEVAARHSSVDRATLRHHGFSIQGGYVAEIVLDDVWKVYPDGTEAVRALTSTSPTRSSWCSSARPAAARPPRCAWSPASRRSRGGRCAIGDRVVNDVPPKERDIAMVFQNYALYPHMSVFDNMAFGLKLQKVPKDEIDERVREAARILGLDELLDRKPAALSGGQRQRVAMGRAIVRHPQAFLMDEPLSNLDAKLRVQMRSEIARIQHDLGVTTIYVTHDQTEAMTMGDRVAVIRKGMLQQVDTPQALYEHPVNLFVAGFIGSPAMNLFDATLNADGDGLAVEFGGFRLPVPAEVLAARPRSRRYADRTVVLGIRPEDMEDAALVTDAPAERRISVDRRPARGARLRRRRALHDRRPAGHDRRHEGARRPTSASKRSSTSSSRRPAGRTTVLARLNPRSVGRQGRADRAGGRHPPPPLLRPRRRRRDLRRMTPLSNCPSTTRRSHPMTMTKSC